ncbi:MAG: hypothetical protein QM594_20125 [Niabella sp.]
MKSKVLLISTFITLVFVSWTALDNIISKLGLSEDTARKYILQNIAGDFLGAPIGSASEDFGGDENNTGLELQGFEIPYSRLLPDIIKGDKTEAAKELCRYVKGYVSSVEFLAAYKEQRDAAKPVSEPPRLDAAAIASLKSSLKEMETNLPKMKTAKMPASAIQQMEQAIAQMKSQIAAQSDPTPNLTLWKKLYPDDAAVAVKNRLNEYLALATTVDFTAATTGSGKNKKFTNPAYEAKSLKWKAVYRAGKEVNTAVTAFVKAWLAEGIKTGSGSFPLQAKPGNTKASVSTSDEEERSSPANRATEGIKSGIQDIKSKAKKVF